MSSGHSTLTEMWFSGKDFLQYVGEVNEQKLMISPLVAVLTLRSLKYRSWRVFEESFKESCKGIDMEGMSGCLVLQWSSASRRVVASVLAVTASGAIKMGLGEPVFIYRARISSDSLWISL